MPSPETLPSEMSEAAHYRRLARRPSSTYNSPSSSDSSLADPSPLQTKQPSEGVDPGDKPHYTETLIPEPERQCVAAEVDCLLQSHVSERNQHSR